MDNGYRCFSRKNFGQLVYICVAVVLIAVGLLLILSRDIGSDSIVLGLKIFTLVAGLGIIAGYFLNQRTRFRPCWTLPMGIMFSSVGAMYLVADALPAVDKPQITIVPVVILFSFAGGALFLSTAIQLRSLLLKRWVFDLIFAVISLVYCFMLYMDTFSLRSREFISCAVLMFIIATALVVEGLTDIVKQSYKTSGAGKK
ncbi:MAG: hypothetical protein J6U38_04415 [Clostridia bacterium]|jgi:hypothetical protein|nr:hypothetical protein [Clostridia bacterium]MBP5665734.1 hypothetical protein [Clostridia bacterium]